MSLREVFDKPLPRRIFALLGLVSILTPYSSNADISKPILKCTRLGQVVIYRNRKFTCVKVKGKLVWNDGVAILPSTSPSPTISNKASTPSPSNSPSMHSSPSPTETSSPIGTPSPSAREFVFAKSTDIPNGKTTVLNGFDPYKRPLSVAFTRINGVIASSLEAACTHAGCIVIPEGPELRCPCHGSRFDLLTGEIIDKSQQALTPLGKIKVVEREGLVYLTI